MGARVPGHGRWPAAMLAVVLVLGAPLARAEDSPPVGGVQKAKGPTAELVVYNRHVASFRGSVLGMTPEERVSRSQDRIASPSPSLASTRFGTKSTSIGQVVTVDGKMAFFLASEDLDPLREETLEEATRRSVQALAQVDAETRESRDVRALLQGGLYSLVATAIFLLFVWAVRRFRRAVTERLGRVAEANAHRLKLGGAALLSSERLSAVVRWVVGIATWVVMLLVAYEWIGFVLGRFPYTRPWGERLVSFLWDLVTTVGLAIVGALPGLALAAIVFVLARFAVEIASNAFDRVERGALDDPVARRRHRRAHPPHRQRGDLDLRAGDGLPLPPRGADRRLQGALGAGRRDGLARRFEPVGPGGERADPHVHADAALGEYVRIAEHEGTVVEIGAFATRIHTGIGEERFLPNALILGTVTRNYSRILEGTGFVVETR